MLFSVVTPSYNQGSFIGDNLASVKSQTVLSEHIVIDGKSDDETVSILEKNSKSLKYWVSELDHGQSEALNKGCRHISGDIFCWLNSDDYYFSNALRRIQYLFERHPNIDIICSNSRFVGECNEPIGVATGQSDNRSVRFLAGMCSPQPSSFVRRSLLEKIGGFREELHYAMDYDFYLQAVLERASILNDSNFLAAYRIHGTSKTFTSQINFRNEWLQVYCNLLHSCEYGCNYLSILKDYGLYLSPSWHYAKASLLSFAQISKSFKFFLHYQYCFALDLGNIALGKEIARLLLRSYPPAGFTPSLMKTILLR